jgi:hypothetical protein
MAFGKKKAVTVTNVDQNNVALLATQALATMRSTRIALVVRLILGPTLMNRWTQKAIEQMLGKMVGKEMPRPPKDLTAEFEASWYRNERGEVALPCRLIKAAIVEGAISTSKIVSKAELKRELRVRGFTSPIYSSQGKKLTSCESLTMSVLPAKNATGGPDLRSRAIVPEGCYIDVVLDFPPTLSPDKVMAAVDGAGTTIGLCDWRPDRGGEFGTFSIDTDRLRACGNNRKEIDRVLKDCNSPEEQFVIPQELLRAFNVMPRESMPDPVRKAMSVAKNIDEQHHSKKNGKARKDEAVA